MHIFGNSLSPRVREIERTTPGFVLEKETSMRRRSFFKALPATALFFSRVSRAQDDGLLPLLGDIHTFLLPDQTRIVVELDATCPVEVIEGPPAAVILQGALYLPVDDTKRFSSGPIRSVRIHTPSYEMFKTRIDLETAAGARVTAHLSGDPPRLIIDVLGQSLAPGTAVRNPELEPLEKEAEQETKQIRATENNESLRLRFSSVVIDPGHGGYDPGAVGLGNTQEKNITLAVALKLATALQRRGLSRVYLTRTDDYYLNLSDRTATANQYRADLFISLHCNANDYRSARGCETFFCSETASDSEAERVARFENGFAETEELQIKENLLDIEWILFRLQRKLIWKNAGVVANEVQSGLKANLSVRNRGVKSAGFFVLKKAKMPSILVESAFISNPDEEKLLASGDFQDRLVGAVTEQLAPFLS
jgi:N-acetylmuramoyl-L-alanine amidase